MLSTLRLLKRFRADQSGQFAIMFALIATPIIIAVAYVGDMTYAGKIKAELKGSLDAAALAAVINQKFNEQERAEFAKAHFNENFEFSDMFKIDVVDASAKRVELAAKGSFPSYIGAMTGNAEFELVANSASVLTTKDIICMMALDPTSEGAFKMANDGSLYADQCSIQVNSTHPRASIVESGSRASGDSFCVAGGATGQYSPYVNTDCARVEDPFQNITAPSTISCNPKDIKNFADLMPLMAMGISTVANDVVLAEGDNAILLPGAYCEPMVFSGKNITLLPGTYVFQESVIFKEGSSMQATDVTFALVGPNSQMQVESGSQIYIKAPATGPFAGLAVYQNPGKTSGISSEPTGVSHLNGGADMTIVGTVYLPSQKLLISEDSTSSIKNKSLAKSPATSFIAHQIEINGSAANVAVDHKTAGLPPMLPRSDEGARLIQ